MSGRHCTSDPNDFCHICGTYIVKARQRPITDFVRRGYLAYFGIKIGDQDKRWAPHTTCSTCLEQLRKWSKGQLKQLPFAIPMIWREPTNHYNDCYFCITKVTGYNCKNLKNIQYPNLLSAIDQ